MSGECTECGNALCICQLGEQYDTGWHDGIDLAIDLLGRQGQLIDRHAPEATVARLLLATVMTELQRVRTRNT